MANLLKDVTLKDSYPNTLLWEKHVNFLKSYSDSKDSYDSIMTEYLRMSGIYWGLTALDLLNECDEKTTKSVMDFVCKCISDEGGISPSIGHDPHILYTLSAVQIAALLKQESKLPVEKIVKYIQSLQQPDGSFAGDRWGEIDTRFSFCAVACLSLLDCLDAIDLTKAVDFVMSCLNFDGGFGSRPGSESHAGLIYCCVGFLSVTGNLDKIDADLLGWWLCERQLPSGGLNGRPEKLPDVCYSWWVLASLSILGRLHWIDQDSLTKFILACQDSETGGFSDRPGDVPDPFHTLFGIAALALLPGSDNLKEVDPTFCMPCDVIQRLGVKSQKLCSP